MADKTSVDKPAVKVLGNPEENRKVIIQAGHSVEDSKEQDLKKKQAFPIALRGSNIQERPPGSYTNSQWKKVKAKRRMQKKSRRKSR